MSEISEPRTAGGAWLVVAAAGVAAVVAFVNLVNSGNVIAWSFGAWLVLGSSLLVALGGALLALHLVLSKGLRGLMAVLVLLGIVGTGVAAYFLTAWILLVAMGVALVGWLIHVAADPSPLD